MSKCKDLSEKDHLCDYCGKSTSVCADPNKNHMCDICLKTISVCLDENKNHDCDICNISLSECVDKNGDHICDYCFGNRFPLYTVTAMNGCLVNDKEIEKIYISTSYVLVFSYSDITRMPLGCNVYNAEGNLIAFVPLYENFFLPEPGDYYAEPVFGTN